ncbi:cell-cycle control medial ring component [Podospora australis]|uniref:Cell-cycle control medial ring component n=1 Tax=Podospora australis TaxID=1536484 RepID=A0AAN7AIU2_9PEZI|nr:cell-cycle control medial ring component [Podospora australis]
MATEVAFAKTFLSLLDTKPPKISPDHVEDPKNYHTNPILLPRPRRAFSRPVRSSPSSGSSGVASGSAPGSEPSVTVLARSPRNPPLDIVFKSQSITTTSALDIKHAVAAQTGIPLAKIKVLYNKKPVGDSKTIKDVLAGEVKGEVEFGLMIMGGAASLPAQPPKPEVQEGGDNKMEVDTQPVAAPGQASGKEVLDSEEFWGDLEGFLQQRVRDEKVAREAVEKFRGAWRV